MRPRKQRRAIDPEPLESLLERAGENRFALHPPPIPERIWRQIVGLRIADRARPVKLVGTTLFVRCASHTWANELTLLAPAILERLAERRYTITAIRFRVGTVEPPPRPPERRSSRVVPPPAPLPKDLTIELRRVGDEDLREAIALAASSNLAWQTFVAPANAKSNADDGRVGRAARASEAPPDARAPRSAETKTSRRDRS